MDAVRNKTTQELLNEIIQKNDINEYLEENRDEFWDPSLSGYLDRLLEKYNVKRADLFRRAGLVGNNYGYEIFKNDKKSPSREILLQISMAFPLTIDETQQVLRKAGTAVLYPRDRRDAYILYALKNQMRLEELNDKLSENGMKILGKD